MWKWMSIALFATAPGCAKKEPPKPAPAAPVSAYGPVILPVLFESGITTVAADQMARIDRAVEELRGSDWTLMLVGLADATGDAEANHAISHARADAVLAVMKEKMPNFPVDERIHVVGIGEKLATGERQSERKVEFVFYVDKGLPPKQVAIHSGVLEEDFDRKRSGQ